MGFKQHLNYTGFFKESKCRKFFKEVPSMTSHFNHILKSMTTDDISHTRTVVQERFKGNEASQWKRPTFDPSPHQNPLTDLDQNWHA